MTAMAAERRRRARRRTRRGRRRARRGRTRRRDPGSRGRGSLNRGAWPAGRVSGRRGPRHVAPRVTSGPDGSAARHRAPLTTRAWSRLIPGPDRSRPFPRREPLGPLEPPRGGDPLLRLVRASNPRSTLQPYRAHGPVSAL